MAYDPNRPYSAPTYEATSSASAPRSEQAPTALAAAMAQTRAPGNYMQTDPGGTTWMRPPGPGGSTTWMYGATGPTAGVDRRAWSNISNPLAFEYGGERGGAGLARGRYQALGANADGMAAPTIDQSGFNRDLGFDDRAWGQQMDAQDMLMQQMQGRGNSVAQQQLTSGLNQAYQQQAMIAGGARGGGANLAAAQSAAANASANLGGQAVAQGAMLRAQEQQAAQQQYAQNATQMRAAALQRAGMSAQMAQQQASLEMQQRGLGQQGRLAYEAMAQGVDQAQLQAQMSAEQQNAQAGMSAAQLQFQRDQASNQMWRQLLGGAITAAGTVGGAMIGGPAGAYAGGAGGAALGGAIAKG